MLQWWLNNNYYYLVILFTFEIKCLREHCILCGFSSISEQSDYKLPDVRLMF